MSRPRKPFGNNQPGRLPATMMKVLAAEMSDPGRLRRAKQYANDGSVLDIIVEPGVVTCEVQGSRATPYVASLAVRRGGGMPLRRDVEATCTCPDDANWDQHACKHVLAAMLVFANELLIEPELLDVWRDNDVEADTAPHPDEHGDEHGDQHDDEPWPNDVGADDVEPRRRHLRLVRDGIEQAREARRAAAPEPVYADPLAEFLTVPEGRQLPEIPDLERIEPRLPRRPDLAAVLRDAYTHLRIEWD
jgi:hypothetical protein